MARRTSRPLAVTVALCLSAGLQAQTNTFPASGNVGIGTPSPGYPLSVVGSANVSGMLSVGSNSNVNFQSDGNSGYYDVGSLGSFYFFDGSYRAVLNGNGLSINNGSTGTAAGVGLVVATGNVGIGTTNPQYLLSVKGTIGAQEVIVTTAGWSDYVFQPTYRLRPLAEVAAYIQENHHLPDIPTEAEVKEKGVSLGDMQVKLLAKVEELTLHMIEADERSKSLEQQNQELRERISRIEAAEKGK